MRETMKRITTARSTQPRWWQALLLRASFLLFLVPLSFPAPAIAQAVSFGPAADFTVGSIPFSVAIGDLNGDGKPDLAVANFNSDNVSILLGTGTGTFGAATNFAVGTNPLSVAIGDLNGDGKADLAVANQTSDNVSILLGTGTGTFGAATNFVAGTSPQYVAIGDLNGDGILDLAVTNNGSFTVSILLGTGTGSFGAATNFAVGSSPRTVAIGDLNGDGKPDLAVANVNSANVSVLLGTGTGTFGVATNFPVGTLPISVAIGDLNGDGKPDLATANGASTVSVLLGTGTGTFGVAVDYPVGSNPRVVTIGDLNGDGKLDLAVVNRNGPTVSILLGTGTGTFGAATNFPMGNSPNSLAIGDLNGDGKLDLATANGTSNDVSVRLNSTVFSPSGGFGAATNFAVGSQPRSVAVSDLNRDGNLDLAVANNISNTVSVLLGTGTGAFGAFTDFAVGTNPVIVATGDLNRDGNPDLAVANSTSNNISVLLGTGTGAFGAATNFTVGVGPQFVAIGDLNGDGKPDLVTANSDGTVSVLLGTGTVTLFGPAANFSGGPTPFSVAIGDLNGDGKLDLAVANSAGAVSTVSVSLGTGAGTFGAATTFGVGINPRSVAIGDLNRDGIPDLAVAINVGTVSVLLGTGTVTLFGPATNFPVGPGPFSVAIGDLNRDGNPDLAVANVNGTTVSVLFGTGTGAFGVATNVGVGTNPASVAIGDFNRDGKPDLAVANFISNNISVLLNAGPPTDLSLTKTDAPDPVTVNATLTYTVTVTNNGPNPATGVIVTDNLPAGVTFNAGLSSPSCSAIGLVVTCTVGNLANAANTPLTIAVTAPAVPGLITNQASVTANEGDPTPGNNSATQQTIVRSVSPSADIQVSVADSQDPVTVGTNITYSMTVLNSGPDVATGVTLATAVPAGTTYVSATPSAGSCLGTTTILCTLNTMTINASALVTLIVTPTTAGTKTLTVSATADPVPPDSNSANNTNILQTTLVTAVGVNVFVVNSTLDGVDANTADNICQTATVGQCTLRAAIQQANVTANNVNGPDVIVFNISGAGVKTISPTSALPTITQPVVIDGTTQPGFAGTPIIELNGTGAGAGAIGITMISGNSTIRGLEINRFSSQGILIGGGSATGNLVQGNHIGASGTGGPVFGNGREGIAISSGATNNQIGGTAIGAKNVISGNTFSGIVVEHPGSTGNIIQGNYIGTNVDGTVDLGNAQLGIFVNGAANTMIGGAGAGNVISGNAAGLQIVGNGNVAMGNLIGTNATGSAALGNDGNGVRVSGVGNTIGGTGAGEANVISGNGSGGILIDNVGTTANVVQGNFIGTNAAGTAALANGGHGVYLYNGPSGNTIGGTVAGARNVISGNTQSGVLIDQLSTTGNLVQGNYIGTNAAGTAGVGNTGVGVSIVNGASSNTIGGTAVGARNVISGNQGGGVSIASTASANNIVQGNYIGTDVSGTIAIGNALNGIGSFGPNTTIGGTAAGAGNLISANVASGIELSGAGSLIQGNLIGTNAAGTAALGNQWGVSVIGSGITIGGTTAVARNIISGNTRDGITISGATATGNQVQGNYIGTNAAGTAALPNALNGVLVQNGATTNTIGGTVAAARNVVSGNAVGGVVLRGPGNTVQGNYVGTNAAGNAAIGNNGSGVSVEASNNTIGGIVGTTPGGSCTGACNLISGNGFVFDEHGIHIEAVSQATIQGNFIGTDVTGTAWIPNRQSGVGINGGSNHQIGGTTASARNLISGNNVHGITIGGTFISTGNIIQGNFIGTNSAGSAAVANGVHGLYIFNGATNNTIGGLTATPGTGAGNVISGNTQDGISIGGGGVGQGVPGNSTVIQGNLIGLAANGTTALGNGNAGVEAVNSGATIGDTNPQARNVIAGNQQYGINFSNSGSNQNVLIRGNYIGTDITGQVGRPNPLGGVLFQNAPGGVVGGTVAGAGNVIAANGAAGVVVTGTQSAGTLIQGNKIGVAADGTTPLGNVKGVSLFAPGGSGGAIVGGTVPGAANIIANNVNAGVEVANGGYGQPQRHAIEGNAIFSNGGLGIDLGADGVTANDTGDGDSGPNNLQNFPGLTSATFSAGTTSVVGSLNSTASTLFRVEFFANAACDGSGNGEGQTFLGFTNVTTNGTGTIPVALGGLAAAVGQFITTTATNTTTNDTSEFSQCAVVTAGGGGGPVNQPPVVNALGPFTATEQTAFSFTATATDGDGPAPITFNLVDTAGQLVPPPLGATLNSSSGFFSWTPASGQGGPWNLILRATDGGGAVGDRAFTITVINTVVDSDVDGVADFVGGGASGTPLDNCPTTPNPDQADQDGDGVGDACEPYTANIVGTTMPTDPQVTLAPAVNPPASGTSYTPTEPIILTSTVTFDPIDFNGGGADPYPAVRPSPFNVIPRVFDSLGQEVFPDRIPEGPPLTLPDDLVTIPVTGAQYSTTLSLHDWFTVLPDGQYTVETTYVNFAQDPQAPPCSGATCLWTGESLAGETTIAIGDPCPGAPAVGSGAGGTGCAYAVKTTMKLQTLTIGGGSSQAPLAGVQVRIFDRNSAAFQAIALSKNPSASLYPIVYETNRGIVGTCITPATGVCYAGVPATGDLLLLVRYTDPALNKVVYVGRTVAASDFVATVASHEIQIMKVFNKQGQFVEYRGGNKLVVLGSILTVIVPDSAIWDGTRTLYPFIFTSDSNWTVDVCAVVPTGYRVVGVYDATGTLIPNTTCTQVLVATQTKVVAFEVEDVGSPEPTFTANLTVTNKKTGKITKKTIVAADLRKHSLNEALKAHRLHQHQRDVAPLP